MRVILNSDIKFIDIFPKIVYNAEITGNKFLFYIIDESRKPKLYNKKHFIILDDINIKNILKVL